MCRIRFNALPRNVRPPAPSIVWKYLVCAVIPDDIQWRLNRLRHYTVQRHFTALFDIPTRVSNHFSSRNFWGIGHRLLQEIVYLI